MKKTKWSTFFQAFLQPGQHADEQLFQRQHGELLFTRLRTVCFMIVITYPLYLALDIYFLTTGEKRLNLAILASLHFLSFFISLLFLLVRKWVTQRHQDDRSVFLHYVCCYYCFYLFIGAAGSLNSQFLTNNIYAYLVILLAASVVFPIPPSKSAGILIGIHLLFLAGLMKIDGFSLTSIMNMINSTATAGIAFFLSATFYFYRKRETESQLLLQKNEKTFRLLFDLNPHPLILARLSGNEILLLNQRAYAYYEGSQLLEKGAGLFFKDSYEQRNMINILKDQKSIKGYLTPHFDPAKKDIWIMLNVELVEYFGEACLLIGTTDVTSFKAEEEKLSAHAFLDELTGIMNRRKGLNILSSLLHSREASPFTLCYIDINGLKTVNDRYGHNKGDQFIQEICQAIQKALHEEDVLFRLGGDEFIILFPNQPPEAANRTWAAIRTEFDRANQISQQPYELSASHGICYYHPGMNISLEELLEMADQEMYKEKRKVQSEPRASSYAKKPCTE
ncbi:sensor domain-containing diguanylate cyclase [Domibacillus robiginosus]|uniref:sensor domain-containing diguanylate cyclase n=1 Tax=Domibacillus robiginosus TaxID=1071054 RepID=UPI00067E4F15|nr:GGDEF domain-containing protein [Domibacillus robiginosus]